MIKSFEKYNLVSEIGTNIAKNKNFYLDILLSFLESLESRPDY